jgi:hypothetical protein
MFTRLQQLSSEITNKIRVAEAAGDTKKIDSLLKIKAQLNRRIAQYARIRYQASA